MTRVLGRAVGRASVADAARLPLGRELMDAITLDLEAPPPLLLLPLRLEYRVVETNVRIRVSGNVGEIFRDDPAITVEAPHVPTNRGRLDARAVMFNTRREIWFRWFPEADFTLRGIAPRTEEETAAIARFDSACGGKQWHALDDAAVVSAWQTLSREVEQCACYTTR